VKNKNILKYGNVIRFFVMNDRKHEDKITFTKIKDCCAFNNFFSFIMIRRHDIAAHELHLLRSLTQRYKKYNKIRKNNERKELEASKT